MPTVTLLPNKNVIVAVIGVLLQAQTNVFASLWVCGQCLFLSLDTNPNSNPEITAKILTV